MSAVWVNGGIDWSTQLLLNKVAVSNFTVALYTDSAGLAVTDVAGTRTETVLAGYARVTLTPANWTGSTSAGLSVYSYAPAITFTFSAYGGGTTINGYYVLNGGGTLVLENSFVTPYVVPSAGGSLTITPTLEEQKF